MIIAFYYSAFILSLLFALLYVLIWHKHFDVNFTLIFTLIPVACLGYVLRFTAKCLEGAVFGTQVIYIGGCFLQLFILLSILNLCDIGERAWLRAILYAACACTYLSVLTIGHLDIFYKNLRFHVVGGTGVFNREYGPMHTFFYVIVVLFFIAGISAIIYSLLRKKQIPRTILSMLVMPDVICMLAFFIGRRIVEGMDLVPLAYLLAEVVYLMIAYRVNLYDVSDTVIDSMDMERSVAYISFDFKHRYLGSNEVARQLIPELADTAVDEPFGYKPSQRRIRHYLTHFEENDTENSFIYTKKTAEGNEAEDRIYQVVVNYLYDGHRKRGYLVTFTDDTEKQKYIRLLDNYNEKLQQDVQDKTQHIVEMHDNLIMSLAMMVESRDNSTGGHIKRTSEGVRILIEEITKAGILNLSDEFCRDVIKAAPMHDLGKIAVDDAVLRKPGRFTDEEYGKMKKHAAEGARVIHEILLHTDDNSFKTVAENVAHYHHERWDGSGYPEGLSGEQIPIEARIMAIADVYDALVSKRVYKEAFGFEKADAIITEGMGTQFDPGLAEVYRNARPRLEEFYRNETYHATSGSP
ncbi:MAG: HD domain-containing protein [Lachnospiraceae bacterium]|nr:HD domain-containing protein [Lachnospiraceae bacterium]